MVDITLCPGGPCPRKENCLRFKTKTGNMQSWFVEAPLDENDMTCIYFIPVDLEKALNHVHVDKTCTL
jgi:hypothetical protein